MQHSQDTINKFIELRAQNASFSRIAEQLGVARSTAFLWGKQYKATIANFRAMELEAVQERFLGSYEERLKAAVERLRRYEEEMDHRKTEYMDMKELEIRIIDARRQVEKLAVVPTFTDEPDATPAPQPAATQS